MLSEQTFRGTEGTMTLGDPEDRVGYSWSQLLQAFAEQTLRTLCLAYKDVAEDAYKEWEPEHQEATLLLQNRAQALHHVYNKMEQNLQVGGWGGVGMGQLGSFHLGLGS